MTSKDVLYKRLCTAVGEEFTRDRFIWFFQMFCERYHRPDLINAKQLTTDDVILFSQYAQYDLRFDNPTPLKPPI
ncbi:MAG: hypothetical protein IJV61_02325 [Paludibacteraceae bacterium]|nr:hypothetical protein [Paludibacteraceae bacterium]